MESLVNIKAAVENVKKLLKASRYYDIKVNNLIKPDLHWQVNENVLELTVKQILINRSISMADSSVSELSVDRERPDTLIIRTIKKTSKKLGSFKRANGKCISDDFAECYILERLMKRLGAKMEFQDDYQHAYILLRVPDNQIYYN